MGGGVEASAGAGNAPHRGRTSAVEQEVVVGEVRPIPDSGTAHSVNVHVEAGDDAGAVRGVVVAGVQDAVVEGAGRNRVVGTAAVVV